MSAVTWAYCLVSQTHLSNPGANAIKLFFTKLLLLSFKLDRLALAYIWSLTCQFYVRLEPTRVEHLQTIPPNTSLAFKSSSAKNTLAYHWNIVGKDSAHPSGAPNGASLWTLPTNTRLACKSRSAKNTLAYHWNIVGEVKPYPSGAHMLPRWIVLTNIRLDCKHSLVTNTLAYHKNGNYNDKKT
jgi:hypothetical protein